jgi:LDH2 family malate/lactate/ureidoglycolate dehydrogenase
MPSYARYSGSDLRALLVATFTHYGVPPRDAEVTAEALVHADEMGIDSHGVARVAVHPAYVPGLRNGNVDPVARPRVVRESRATATIDGMGGLGPVAATEAAQLALDKARRLGAGFVSITNSRHYGAASHYALMAIEHGMIGFSMTIGGRGVVPTYGRGRRIGINPISVAAPSDQEHPWLLDIATSVVAAGKLELARMEGKPVPLGWIVDREGSPTTDPARYWDGGAILPLGGPAETGGYKGYGLSVMIDILCGVLSGCGFSASLDSGGATATPHFVGALNVEGFTPLASFKAMMDNLIRTLRATETAPGHDHVLVHGEKEAAALADRVANGVPLHPEVVGHLESMAREAGVAFPKPVG